MKKNSSRRSKSALLMSVFSFLMFALLLPACGNSASKPAGADLDEASVESFAKAQIAIHRVFMKYDQAMTEVQSKDDQAKKDLETKIHAEMEEALQQNGLNRESYNQIVQQSRQNKVLAERLSKAMVEVQKIPVPAASISPEAVVVPPPPAAETENKTMPEGDAAS